MRSNRKEVFELGIRDQVRQYRVVLEKCFSGVRSEILETASVDNYQLEGRMNMNRENAHKVLIRAGYSPEEATEYLEAIPRREIKDKVFVDAEKWDTDPLYRRYKENEFRERLAQLVREISQKTNA